MSRKLEFALRREQDYDVRVKPLALTADLIQKYSLPRIPIKETERRAGKFEAAFGSGAVELDALEALHAGVLGNLVRGALGEYYSDEAEEEINTQEEALRQAVNAQVAAITARYQPQIAALQAMQEELRAVQLDASKYAVERFEAEVEEDDSDWLFNSERSYLDQIDHYKAHKGLEMEAW